MVSYILVAQTILFEGLKNITTIEHSQPRDIVHGSLCTWKDMHREKILSIAKNRLSITEKYMLS